MTKAVDKSSCHYSPRIQLPNITRSKNRAEQTDCFLKLIFVCPATKAGVSPGLLDDRNKMPSFEMKYNIVFLIALRFRITTVIGKWPKHATSKITD